ncbi:MAG: hypothetical protein LBM09_03020 [Candidatus Nomurabacteria bacterium]|jgi:ribosomal protein L37AE/L43A|nr:hypothetical protein [Candidatus Nomurabacteria bacterium]
MTLDELVEQLRADFPKLTLEKSEHNFYSPTKKTVFYTGDIARLLHEIGHGILDHTDFTQDIELIHIERDAWEKARELAPNYGFKISDTTIETALDDYRDWLHARSTCPKCGQTGIQSIEQLNYHCLNCDAKWTNNDARSCGLKRRVIKKSPHRI